LDVQTYNIDEQFLWGSALMIVPVLEEVRMFRDSLVCFPSVKKRKVYEITIIVYMCLST